MRIKTKAATRKANGTKTQIQEVCERIAHDFQPEKIILFGSHALGQQTPDSDVDLMVVMPFEGDPIEKAVSILKQINMLIPIDLLVRTQEQVERRLEMGDRFMHEIVERGKVLYEVDHA